MAFFNSIFLLFIYFSSYNAASLCSFNITSDDFLIELKKIFKENENNDCQFVINLQTQSKMTEPQASFDTKSILFKL